MKRASRSHAPEHALERYNAMRDFTLTAEPSGRIGRSETGRSFVVQMHDARRRHYDFRLEHDGVLLSWAVPKGPSLVPGDKRLAVQTEDHPLDYRDFEGTIPEGQYGGGPVIVWDRGTWKPLGDPREALLRGQLDFELDGEKLHGRFLLVRTKTDPKTNKASWLLLKRTDAWATTGPSAIVDEEPASVLTGRTIEDVRAGVPAAPARKGRAAARRRAAPRQTPSDQISRGTSSQSSRSPESARLPDFGSIKPELATLVDGIPAAGPWIYEIKYDGYRAIAWLDEGHVRIASRRGLDWTDKYPLIADALGRVRARTAIFDGEVAYVREDGRTDFQRLQNALGSGSAREQAHVVYFVFDLLFYDGVDLRDRQLAARKDILRTLLAGESPPLRLSDHIEDGRAFLREACAAGLEGVVGKRQDQPYIGRRTRDWIKVKCAQRQELVVVGFTPPKGSRQGIGALLLGLRDDGRLRYAGKVGTGFSDATLRDLAKRLQAIESEQPSVVDPPRMRGASWVRPELVAEVRFSEWTSEGLLRHPSFEGLRLDKTAREVHRETEEPPPKTPGTTARPRLSGGPRVDGIAISHADRVIDVGTGLTKLDLARYAGAVAELMLPFAAKRPLMFFRCPFGTQATVFRQSDRRTGKPTRCFVQKHSGQGLNEVNLSSATVGDEEVLFVTHARQIILLAQNNAVEIHGWGSRMPRWDRPDWIVFDLDPDEALPFTKVVASAFELRDALRTLHLESWVKTTGGKGLHVVVPIERRYDWPTVRRAAGEIATLMARLAPDRYVATMTKRARTGKIFIDYFRNAEGATAVLPYSARARPALPVALPVEWDELDELDPTALTIATVPTRLVHRKVDPWRGMIGTKQRLPRELLEAAERDRR